MRKIIRFLLIFFLVYVCCVPVQAAQNKEITKAEIERITMVSASSLKISWGVVPEADGYIVYRKDSQDGKFSRLKKINNKQQTTYVDNKVVCGHTYYYKILSYRKQKNKTLYGKNPVVKKANTVPEKTEILETSICLSDKVTLHWKESKGADGYQIYRKSETGFELVKTVKKNLVWTNKSLEKEQTYYYKIRPYVLVDGKKVVGKFSKVYVKENLVTMVNSIQKYEGTSYVYGGTTTKGWDCSGFTQWVMKNIANVNLPRTSGEQARFGTAVNKQQKEEWQVGDILVYSSGSRVCHVAVYLGENKMIHALNRKYGTIIQDVDEYEVWDRGTHLTGVRRCL